MKYYPMPNQTTMDSVLNIYKTKLQFLLSIP